MPSVRKRRFAIGLNGAAVALAAAGILLLVLNLVQFEKSMDADFRKTLDNKLINKLIQEGVLPRNEELPVEALDWAGVVRLNPGSFGLFLPLLLATGSFFLDREVQGEWLAKTSASAVLILHLMLLATVCECRRYGISIVL